MKTPFIILAACLAISMSQTAQCQIDPGAPDSIILEQGIQVPYFPGQYSVTHVDVYFVSDDDVNFCFLPLTWTCIDDQIWLSRSIWYEPFINGIHYDTIFIQQHREFSLWYADVGGEPGEPFNSHGQRILGLTLRLLIGPEAEPQIITIDQFEPSVFGDSTVFVPTTVTYGTQDQIEEQTALPEKFGLSQNYPNPFNSNTFISYELSQDCEVAIELYNILGQRVKTINLGWQKAGKHQLNFDGNGDSGMALPSGMYLYCLKAGEMRAVQKMTILR